MGRLHHLFEQAEPEEQGSFCKPENETHYNNMSAFDAEVTKRTAEEEGCDTLFWDGDDDVDTRYNHSILEQENDLVADDEFLPAKHRPGR